MDNFLLKWISDRFGDWIQEEKGVVLPRLLAFSTKSFNMVALIWAAAVIVEGLNSSGGIQYFYITAGLLLAGLIILVYPRERERIKQYESWDRNWDDSKVHDQARRSAFIERETLPGLRIMNLFFFLLFLSTDIRTMMTLGFGESGFDGENALALMYFFILAMHGYIRCMFPRMPNNTLKELKLQEVGIGP